MGPGPWRRSLYTKKTALFAENKVEESPFLGLVEITKPFCQDIEPSANQPIVTHLNHRLYRSVQNPTHLFIFKPPLSDQIQTTLRTPIPHQKNSRNSLGRLSPCPRSQSPECVRTCSSCSSTPPRRRSATSSRPSSETCRCLFLHLFP